MSNIEVGEYIRTRDGYIDKVDALYGMIENAIHLEIHKWYDKKNIVKHSKNIIDLIEEGDYVNCKKIIEIRQNTENGLRYLYYDYIPIKYYVERTDKIKSIATKEQFREMEYRVDE